MRRGLVAVCLKPALAILIFSLAGASRAQTLEHLVEICDAEQIRLDMLDGKKDTAIEFNTLAQKERGKKIYFQFIDHIQTNILRPEFPENERLPFYKNLVQTIQNLKKTNVRFLAYFEQYFSMVLNISENNGAQRDMELLKNQVPMALDCIPYFVGRSYAQEVMVFAAGKKPYDVLTKYLDYNREKWFLSVLETVAKNDPNAVKQFFGTPHAVNTALKTSIDPVVLKLYDIFYEYGRASSGYTNIELVYNNKLTIDESETLVQDEKKWFQQLCILRANPNILGTYSVDQELSHYSLQQIRKINFLHDEKDEIRFASATTYNATQLYNLMVYSRDEIFTSTFLGLFKRMMQRRTDSSLFVLFKNQGLNKFRTFVQMCAGYNTLQTALNTMTKLEREMLIDEIVKDLETTGGNLEPAVEVADIFGSITDSLLRIQMSDKLGDELRRCFLNRNMYGARLYGLLYKLSGGSPEKITGTSVNFDIPLLDKVEVGLLFPDGKNIQQHVFFDDEDGEAAFNSFAGMFKSDVNYKFSDGPGYVKIESVKGNKVIIYCNKPKSETGLESIRKIFEANNRYPDIVVHRGHSYHLGTTVDLLTNNVKIAILGSCGGYLNISRILDNASDAQIVSSKQVGTWTVNNPLLKGMSETLRTGDGGLDWMKLWAELDKKLKNNDKWGDYIPPYKNLGVRFVKAFETI
ncbi:MAG: hypothetical protein KG003_04265 [Bacteroidetes bacterium]|nr:hypothetical protein [Bacteroidota bacterium]